MASPVLSPAALGIEALEISTPDVPPLSSTACTTPPATPAHRSHDTRNNLKRSDPFQFGSRYLLEEDDVFEFNAWDHVETDSTYKSHAEAQYAAQRTYPVSDFDKKRFNGDPSKWWNLFYKNNTSNFFKNRQWLLQEFPILATRTEATAPPTTLLEVGAGAGNTAFPILAQNQNPHLKIHACDFSSKAVALIRANEAYDERFIRADEWDVAGPTLPPGIEPGSVDVVLMIFVFSALAPEQWAQAVANVYRVLKEGGEVLFRDYGRGDLAQVRFRKGRYLRENFYVRGDGTRVYFFEEEELRRVWSGGDCDGKDTPSKVESLAAEETREQEEEFAGTNAAADAAAVETVPQPHFHIANLGVDRRLLVNRQKKLKMYRCWMQGRFRKVAVSEESSAE
ncbi:MAG: hypothetical protein M1829_003077 [Trizodia sp. TS-e1964]|nr:MAG: hypothetical protein M1829_003077 [Trizodia sp. TS-e1964]